jgi:hypothetical protein
MFAPMDLHAYLTARDGKVDRLGGECARIAKKAATTPYYIYMLALGHKSPSLQLAQRIAVATKGSVPVSDWPIAKAQRKVA